MIITRVPVSPTRSSHRPYYACATAEEGCLRFAGGSSATLRPDRCSRRSGRSLPELSGRLRCQTSCGSIIMGQTRVVNWQASLATRPKLPASLIALGNGLCRKNRNDDAVRSDLGSGVVAVCMDLQERSSEKRWHYCVFTCDEVSTATCRAAPRITQARPLIPSGIRMSSRSARSTQRSVCRSCSDPGGDLFGLQMKFG